MTAPLVLKLGGELVESSDGNGLSALAGALVDLAARPLVVVHGGGREIDAAIGRAGLVRRQVDGLRITDEPTLAIVLSVLAGLVNTRLVAAICAAGGAAVGLTGVDANTAPVVPAPLHRMANGDLVDLQRVGAPTAAAPPPALIGDLLALGYIPVVASVSAAADGRLFNVNADTLAADLAGRLGASRLVLAGGTPGVLDGDGHTLSSIDADAIEESIAGGRTTAGMAAKLRACVDAIDRGVSHVSIVDGRDPARLARLLDEESGPAQTLVCAPGCQVSRGAR
ncbi:MAG TPA: acetylglutamate kinase [Vicinamibacterales bacterium]|nr:acetylglutamate kinase [Vicinamibacterales bacterium]